MYNLAHDEALPPRQNIEIKPSEDSVLLNSAAVAVPIPITHGKTKMISSVAAALYDLPDGQYPGQRKMLTADVSGSGTCVASAAALAKLTRLGGSGQVPQTVTVLTFDADGEFAVLEWNGTDWNILYASATVTTS